MLQRALAWRAPEAIDGRHMPTLLALAKVDWVRSPDRFEGSSLRELADHLLRQVRYPLPEAIYALLLPSAPNLLSFTASSDRERAARILACLGAGGSVEDASKGGLLPQLDRRERHAFWVSPPVPSLDLLVLSARVSAVGGPAWLAPALHNARIQPSPEMLLWFVRRTGAIAAEQIGPVIDFLRADPARLDPLRGEIKDAVVGWSAQRILREASAWHESRVSPALSCAPLPKAPFRAGRFTCGEQSWEMAHLPNGRALYDEGAALRHCVATYYAAAATGRISLWSLRCEGERALTVEVLNAERSIVQARGLHNRLATDAERAALERWASEQQILVRKGVFS